MGKLVAAKLLVIVNISFLKNFFPHLLSFLGIKLTLGEKPYRLETLRKNGKIQNYQYLLNITDSYEAVPIKIINAKGIVDFDVSWSSFTQR